MRLLLFNLATDVDDPVLGFTTGWIRAIARHVEFVHVITMRVGHLEIPDNVRVYSVGKERGYSEPRRAIEFYRHLLRVLQNDKIDLCFSHMMPLFTVMAGPLLKARRIPVVTWFAHPKLTWTLQVAHHLSDQMLASVASAYPYKRDKFAAIGQGIDTELFSPRNRKVEEQPPIILCVGRLSPVKDHPTLLKATRLLKQRYKSPFRVVIIGGPTAPCDESYVRSLREQVHELGLNDMVEFAGPVNMKILPSWYRRSTVVVNMTGTGSGDKVVWEAMACGRLSVVANEGFKQTLGEYADRLFFSYDNSEELAERLAWVLSLSPDNRDSMGAYLRGRVVSMHGLERLATTIVELFESITARTGTSEIQQQYR